MGHKCNAVILHAIWDISSDGSLKLQWLEVFFCTSSDYFVQATSLKLPLTSTAHALTIAHYEAHMHNVWLISFISFTIYDIFSNITLWANANLYMVSKKWKKRIKWCFFSNIHHQVYFTALFKQGCHLLLKATIFSIRRLWLVFYPKTLQRRLFWETKPEKRRQLL